MYNNLLLLRRRLRHLRRWKTKPIAVAEEHDALVLALGTGHRLDPLAPSGALPHALEEADGAALGVGAVVDAHDGLDGLGGLVGLVEGDRADVVVQHVRLDDAVEDVAPDEAEFAVDGRGGAADVVPGLARVMGEGWVGVLEIGDGNWWRLDSGSS